MEFSDNKQSLPNYNNREDITDYYNNNGYQETVLSEGPVICAAAVEQRLKAARNTWDYEEILSILGFGKTQWILLLISGLLTMTSMAAQLSMGIIAISAQCEFEMSQREKGVMMAACVAGLVISTFIWGYVSDIWGRRNVLIYNMFATCFFEFVQMFVTNIWFFNFLNLLTGISLGAISAVLYPYLGEFNTSKYRAIVMNYSTMFVAVTAIYVPATSWLVLSSDWSLNITDSFVFKPWRLIILFSLLPGLIGTFMLLPFPESPKLLLSQEKQVEALKALNWVADYNTGLTVEIILKTSSIHLKSEELSDTKSLNTSKGNMLSNIWETIVSLFYKPHGLDVTLAVAAMFSLYFASMGMQIWYPEIINRTSAGSLSGNSSTVCEILDESFIRDKQNAMGSKNMICDNTISTKTYIDNMIMGFAFLVGFSIQGALLNPLGRKNVLLVVLAVGTLSGILLHIVANTTGVLILFCLYILLPGLSLSIMCGAVVDLVPTHLRGKAVSLAMTLGRLGLVVASNLIAGMLEPYCNGIFAIVTSTMIICGALVYFLPI